jgi:hypothetical protein
MKSSFRSEGQLEQFHWPPKSNTSNIEKEITMSMSVSMNTRASFLAVTMLAGCIAAVSPARAAGPVESEKVSALFSDARMQAFQLREDAGMLESYTRSNLSWESHAVAIDRVREDVNKMGRILGQLQDARGTAAPWQQEAIDRLTPVAKELAANTTTGINALNANRAHVNAPAYQEYLEAINDSANNLAATIADFMDYGKTKERMARLAGKLEIPAEK